MTLASAEPRAGLCFCAPQPCITAGAACLMPLPRNGRRSVIRLRKPAAIAAEGDGPCKFYREGHRWVLGDTYREPRKMYLWDLYRSDVFTVGILDSADWPGPAHTLAPLNPHWSPNGVLPAHAVIARHEAHLHAQFPVGLLASRS